MALVTDNTVAQVVGLESGGAQVAKDCLEGVYAPVWTQLGDWAGTPGPSSVAGMFMLSGDYCHVSIAAHGVVSPRYGAFHASVSLPVEPESFVGQDGVIGAVSVFASSNGGNKILGFVGSAIGEKSAIVTLDQIGIGDATASVGVSIIYKIR